MKIAITIIIVSLLSQLAWGQEFVAESALPIVPRDGFYKVPLSPKLTSYANTSLSNLRIVDRKGVQVPFVVEEEKGLASVTGFVPYALDEKTILPDSCTILVLKNNANTTINNLNLVIRNAAILKEAALYGSDDKKTWYALKDKFNLGYVQNDEGTQDVKIIEFPASDYTYYKLWINDKQSAPLNIVQAGYYTETSRETKYEEVAMKSMYQENDAKQNMSYVRISLDTLQLLDKISWNVEGIPFYQRSASLYTVRETTDRKGKKKQYRDYITSFQINSRHENTQYLPATRTDNLWLEIANEDNPPLAIADIRLYQVSRHLVAWLKKDETYALKFGGENLGAPVYDLESFKDSIPATLSVITPASASLIKPASSSASTTVFTTKLFIWGAIVVVIIALGFMSVKMIRETRAAD